MRVYLHVACMCTVYYLLLQVCVPVYTVYIYKYIYVSI